MQNLDLSQFPESIQKGFLDNDLEKATYANTWQNKKLGRVGQQIKRGGESTKDNSTHGTSSGKAVKYNTNSKSELYKQTGLKPGTVDEFEDDDMRSQLTDEDIESIIEAEYEEMDLSRHTDIELQGAMHARLRNGMSENHPEVQQIQQEILNRAKKKEGVSKIPALKTATVPRR